MKRRELIKKIEAQGGVLLRHGGKHDWYQNPATKVCQPVPRHNEIKNRRQASAAREDIGVAVWEDWLAKMEINVGGSYLTQNCVF